MRGKRCWYAHLPRTVLQLRAVGTILRNYAGAVVCANAPMFLVLVITANGCASQERVAGLEAELRHAATSELAEHQATALRAQMNQKATPLQACPRVTRPCCSPC